MVTCQSSELGWEVTVELPADFLSLGRGSVKGRASGTVGDVVSEAQECETEDPGLR